MTLKNFEIVVPNGIPGKVQDFQVVLIESTLRVFWSPPCTSVTLSVSDIFYIIANNSNSYVYT